MTASTAPSPRQTRASPVSIPSPTGQSQLEAAVARLRENARKFTRLSLDERAQLARSMQAGYLRTARASVEAACAAKGIPLGSPLEGEEWTLGPWFVVRQLRLIRQSLLALKYTGNTPIGQVGRTVDQRIAVQVFPAGTIDGMLFQGVRVDVHLQSGITEEEMNASRARFYKSPDHEGRVVLVLGAGNISGIPTKDVLTKMFIEGKVCVLKMNPVNAYLGPFLEEAFADAIRQGFLAVVYGGADEGEYLANHAGVDEVHITGSDKTHDTSCGDRPDPSASGGRRQGRPLLEKPVTAELGNVSPVHRVPGPTATRSSPTRLKTSPRDHDQRLVRLQRRQGADPPEGLGPAREVPGRVRERPSAPPTGGRTTRARSIAGGLLQGTRRIRRFGAGRRARSPGRWCATSIPSDRDEPRFRHGAVLPDPVRDRGRRADPVEFLDAAVTFVNERSGARSPPTRGASQTTRTRHSARRWSGPSTTCATARSRQRLAGAVRLRHATLGRAPSSTLPISRAARAGCTTP